MRTIEQTSQFKRDLKRQAKGPGYELRITNYELKIMGVNLVLDFLILNS